MTICLSVTTVVTVYDFRADGEVMEVQGVTRRGAAGATNSQGFDIDESEFVAASEGSNSYCRYRNDNVPFSILCQRGRGHGRGTLGRWVMSKILFGEGDTAEVFLGLDDELSLKVSTSS